MADMVMETPVATSRRFRNAGLWALQIAGAAMFFMAGTPKLTGAESMSQVFTAVGLVAAVIAHLTVLGGSPAIPLALLIAMAIVAWGRRERTARLFRR